MIKAICDCFAIALALLSNTKNGSSKRLELLGAIETVEKLYTYHDLSVANFLRKQANKTLCA